MWHVAVGGRSGREGRCSRWSILFRIELWCFTWWGGEESIWEGKEGECLRRNLEEQRCWTGAPEGDLLLQCDYGPESSHAGNTSSIWQDWEVDSHKKCLGQEDFAFTSQSMPSQGSGFIANTAYGPSHCRFSCPSVFWRGVVPGRLFLASTMFLDYPASGTMNQVSPCSLQFAQS